MCACTTQPGIVKLSDLLGPSGRMRESEAMSVSGGDKVSDFIYARACAVCLR
jgi:hypothetical protein